jgi:hypothetical protein
LETRKYGGWPSSSNEWVNKVFYLAEEVSRKCSNDIDCVIIFKKAISDAKAAANLEKIGQPTPGKFSRQKIHTFVV